MTRKLAGYAIVAVTFLALIPLASVFALGSLLAGRDRPRRWRR